MAFLQNTGDANTTDQDMLAAYKRSGDLRVLASLYQRYMDLVYGVCLKYLKDTEASKDAVMNVFEELIGKVSKHEITQFKGWLYVLAKNHCLMQLRKQKQIPLTGMTEFMQLSEPLHLEAADEKEQNLNWLSDCIEHLSADQKYTVQLFYLQEKSYKEIAALTKTEWSGVRSMIQNARRNLKICMDKKSIEESAG